MSAGTPVSRSRTRAAFAVGATPNTGTAVGVEVVDGGAQHRGLAGAGRADDEHEPVVAGDRCGGVGLQHIQTCRLDGGGWCGVVGLGVERPGEDEFFFGEDLVGRDVR